MTTANGRTLRLSTGLLLLWGAAAQALTLDDRGEMRLGMRAYSNVRINAEAQRGTDDPLSFPRSGLGHLRQHRYFMQLKFDHDLKRIGQQYGWAWLLGGWMNPDLFKYSLQYRGEGEGIYDYGSQEWSSRKSLDNFRSDLPTNAALGLDPVVCNHKLKRKDGTIDSYCDERIRKLRRIARQRHTFFAGYLDYAKGPVSVRIGRQSLSWGETDVFQLIDHINPIDNGFGGFLLGLDERRIPLDMVEATYRFGEIGPSSDTFLEGFVAQGNRVGQSPGIPNGSAWSPGGIGSPNIQIRQKTETPDRWDVRGGARLVGNVGNATVSVAHYWTYFDIPAARYTLPGPSNCNDADPNTPSALNIPTPKYCNPLVAHVQNPRVPITGGSISFPVPSLASIVRSEMAYNWGEPFNRQGRGNSADASAAPGTPGYQRLVDANNIYGGLDPFVWPRFLDINRKNRVEGRALRLNTINAALGLDVNRLIPWLNADGTSFLTMQLFYKHVFDSPGDLILPVPYSNALVDPKTFIVGRDGIGCKTKSGAKRSCRLQPRFFHLNDNQFTNTVLFAPFGLLGQAKTIPGLNLAVQLSPVIAVLYDWQGAYVIQPGISLTRAPFTFVMDYSFIGGAPTGQIGNLRDRDNVRIQAEFAF